jgi:hypothetical protein
MTTRAQIIFSYLATLSLGIGIGYTISFKTVPSTHSQQILSSRAVNRVEQHPEAIQASGNSSEAEDRRKADAFFELKQLAFSHFADAVAWIRKNIPSKDQDDIIKRLVWDICRSDLTKTMDVVASCADPVMKAYAFNIAINQWSRKDPQLLAKYAADNFVGQIKGEAMGAAVNNFLLSGNTAAAVETVAKMPYGSVRTRAIESLGAAFTDSGTAMALEWASSLQLKEDREKALSGVAWALIQAKDIDGLLELANSDVPDEHTRDLVVAETARLTANLSGIDAAKTWVNSLPKEEQENGISGLVLALAPTDPSAATILARSLPDNIRLGADSSILATLTKQDPSVAATWVVSNVSGQDQIQMAKELTSSWYDIDSIELSTWVNSLSPGPLKDAALGQEAVAVVKSDRQTAIATIQAISDANTRNDIAHTLNISPQELAEIH